MGAAPRSVPPAASSRPRAKALPLRSESGRFRVAPFRAGEVPRSLEPARKEAREAGAFSLDRARVAAGYSKAAFGEAMHIKSDRKVDEALTGQLAISFGEVTDNAPVAVLLAAFTERFRARLERERAAGNDEAAKLIAFYLDTLERIASLLPRR